MIRSFEGHSPRLAPGAWVDEQACVLGAVALGEDVSVWPMAVVRGDVNSITIGARSNVQDNSTLHVTHDGPYSPGGIPLVIGDDVTIGHGVTLHACTIGNRCLIGMGAVVLDGAEIGDDTLIAAGTLVPPGKRLEGGWVYRGSPAQPVRKVTDDERDNFRYSAAHYVRLKQRHEAT